MKTGLYESEFFNFDYRITPITDETQFPFHSHESYEIYWFIDGEGTYFVEGSKYALKPDMILLMRSAEMHRPKLKEGCEYKRVTIHFTPQFLTKLDPEHRLLAPFVDHPPGVENMYCKENLLSNTVYECLASMTRRGGDAYLDERRLSSLLYSVLHELYDAHMRRKDSKENYEKNLIAKIIHYIEEHLDEPLSLATLQSKFYISKTHLTRLFKQTTGLPVWEYIGIKRLTFARAKLREGIRASVVAQSCGFGDYSSFYRAYKKRFGESPTETKQ